MNLRSLANLLGLKPAARTYGHDIRVFMLPRDGRVELACWRHPNESAKEVRQEVVDDLRLFLRPGDVAIDIGAHTGDTTVPMALAVGASGLVLALEPNPYVFPVLEANAALNGDRTAIVALNFAATREAGPVEFEYSDAGFCNGGRHEGISRWRHGHPFRLVVQGENLEAYLAREHAGLAGRIRFVKVDAEGYDLAVLESIAGVIDREQPFIQAEVHRLMPPDTRVRLARFLTSRGYQLHRVEGDAHRRGPAIAPGDFPMAGQFDVFAVPARR